MGRPGSIEGGWWSIVIHWPAAPDDRERGDVDGGGQGIGGGNSEQLLAQILQCLKEQNSILAQLKK